jgi:hypothetical protein
MFYIQHQSGLFYTNLGKTPHVSKSEAARYKGFTSSQMQRIVEILNTAGRGIYTAVAA